MNTTYVYASLTRIADLHREPFHIEALDRAHWANGDYVATRIQHPGSGTFIELQNGRMMVPLTGEQVIGALGVRHATLEATGSWEAAVPAEPMSLLTAAGLVGKMTSRSTFSPLPISVEYLGHITRQGKKLRMMDFVEDKEPKSFDAPVILLVGTSMSAGKTTAGRIVTDQLKSLGYRVLGVKMTGAGRYRDVLALKDAGADRILDFVDVGLPSSICPPEVFEPALVQLRTRMALAAPDVAVVEIGASPYEPYNGAMAIEALGDAIRFRILCASDPYAVYGVMKGFGFVPDLVTGPTTNTIAAEELVAKLCGTPTLNLMDSAALPSLRDMLREALLKARGNAPNQLSQA